MNPHQCDIFECGSCGYCLDGCAVYSATYSEALSPRAKSILLRKYAEGLLDLQSVTERLYTCTMCGRCEDVCPSHAKITQAVKTWRAAHPLENHTLRQSVQSACEMGNPYTRPQSERESWLALSSDPEADVAYFPGCTTSLMQPQIAQSFMRVVKDRLPLQVIDDVCCGSLLSRTGFLAEAQEIMERNITYFKTKGIKTLITSCAGCYSHFLEYPFNIRVMHTSEILNTYLDELEPQPLCTTYHDPCHLLRNSITSQPRRILSSLSSYTEKESQSCCGAGGGMLLNFREVADSICRTMLKNSLPDVTLVTACPFCLYHMKRNSFHKMMSIEELVASCV
ncbi:MAG: (Fe-S)-binding protein [Theionarchaea archaeon]|nr:(Fe-S)-binding protein [Theionarchaea archaeon]MBU7001612.1 (Fe-S)-binding protein [Theionarchaea archaeon]MBU7021068.1 (Fe-S)-binding protein [Theionarchaea archaeon]MBU7036073.1 (Fe-S)-binding protein [Theionarchaea archaeon]MBU7040504.1 (Fe-S)-binding protein [Theionarchaea archaeon]